MLYSHQALIDDKSSQCTAAFMITPICLNELFNQLRNSHQGNRKH